MRIIPLFNSNQEAFIKRAVKNDSAAQKAIYDYYSPKMLGVCRMYIRDLQFAEDVMLEGFFKVFKSLKSFKQKGSFEGWIRRIMIHQALDFLKTKKQLNFSEDLENDYKLESDRVIKTFETEYIQHLIDDLPEGYRVIFIMYAVEGYNHAEIAKTLNISESTSRSQLTKARKMLQMKLKAKEEVK